MRYGGSPKCPPPIPVAHIIFGIMGALIAIGLALLLIWRFLLYLYDRAEYARFIDESKNAKWNRVIRKKSFTLSCKEKIMMMDLFFFFHLLIGK